MRQSVSLVTGRARLAAELAMPRDPIGVVLFAHGSGSGRASHRNRLVAQALRRRGIATFLFDLLTARERRQRANLFDIPLLARRFGLGAAWLARQPGCASLPVGYFGSSTGAAAALAVAARRRPSVAAIVSRGGRPDLVEERLPKVRAPTLLIVGGADRVVVALNRRAFGRLGGAKKIAVVPRASHLFEEPGAHERVTELAVSWFARYLKARWLAGRGVRPRRSPARSAPRARPTP